VIPFDAGFALSWLHPRSCFVRGVQFRRVRDFQHGGTALKRTLHTTLWLLCGALLFAQTTPGLGGQNPEPSISAPQPQNPAHSGQAGGNIEILSDTEGVDFHPYLAAVLKRVRMNWYSLIPQVARAPVTKKGKASIEFSIMKDGRVSNMKLTEPSGDASLDRAAWGGVTTSNPFPALPAEFSGQYILLRFHFYYNPGELSVDKTRIQQPLAGDAAALKNRAEAGDSKAQVNLGAAYATGDGVTADDVEAARWFRKAAEQGDAAGEFNLAILYAQGRGVPKDQNEAAKWMQRAADQGFAAGQFGLGSMYERGKGVPQSATEAAAWYRKAADQGNVPAMNNLAFLLATTTDPKLRNPKEALSLAQKAVSAEPNNAAHQDTLARAYFETGQPEKAAEAEQRAVALKPDNPSYKEALEKYRAGNR